jgi:hypothetical protein
MVIASTILLLWLIKLESSYDTSHFHILFVKQLCWNGLNDIPIVPSALYQCHTCRVKKLAVSYVVKKILSWQFH